MEEVKKISHAKWDAMLERITHTDYPISGWFPTMNDALELTVSPERVVKNYEFIMWILESDPDMKLTEEQKEIYEILQEAIKDCTVFTK